MSDSDDVPLAQRVAARPAAPALAKRKAEAPAAAAAKKPRPAPAPAAKAKPKTKKAAADDDDEEEEEDEEVELKKLLTTRKGVRAAERQHNAAHAPRVGQERVEDAVASGRHLPAALRAARRQAAVQRRPCQPVARGGGGTSISDSRSLLFTRRADRRRRCSPR